MPRTAIWLRVFVGLLVAILPPILLLLGVARLSESVFHSDNPNLIAAILFFGALLWAGILAIVFTGRLADEFRSFLSIAEGGADPEGDERTAYQRLASTLDERNRQVSALAQQSSLVPIDDDPRSVVDALVSAVRVVMTTKKPSRANLSVIAPPTPQRTPTGRWLSSSALPCASLVLRPSDCHFDVAPITTATGFLSLF